MHEPLQNKRKRSTKELEANTRAIHHGRSSADHFGFVNSPAYRGSTVLHPSFDDLLGGTMRYRYGTVGSPTRTDFVDTITGLENSAGAVPSASGLSAVSLALHSVLNTGDHLLYLDSIYEPSKRVIQRGLSKFGIVSSSLPSNVGDNIREFIRPNTTALLLEAPGTDSMEIVDIPRLASIAKEHGIKVILDNTWGTPLLIDAYGHGVDMVVQAATKYISGYSDILMGVVSANAECWPALEAYSYLVGNYASNDDIYLCTRGLRSMATRLRQHEASAIKIAQWLRGQSIVQSVRHPALEDHPDHKVWIRTFKGSSGLFSFQLAGGKDQARAFCNSLRLFGLGYSWGGYLSLAKPVKMELRANQADSSALTLRDHKASLLPNIDTSWIIRLSIGLESPDDLINDLDAGLRAAGNV